MFATFLILLFIQRTLCTRTCSLDNMIYVCPSRYGCIDNKCEICTKDEHCNKFSYCSSGQCKHKDMTYFTWHTIIGMIGAFGISILGGATGLGGGSFIVPLLALVAGFQSSDAVAIAQASILGNGLISFFNGVCSKHPTREKPRMDCDVVFVMFPSLLLGSFIGVFLAPLLPQFLITVFLALFLSVNLFRTIQKVFSFFFCIFLKCIFLFYLIVFQFYSLLHSILFFLFIFHCTCYLLSDCP